MRLQLLGSSVEIYVKDKFIVQNIEIIKKQ
jgi:hypothetical protein